ncbi:hypothetical protein DW820_01465 [Streptococcus parasanguinis]|uniref:Uncharacterized protein n=1 Tax=Streptococcus parasanguinis TaxID=1318 RepID=A0A414CLE1_STRPA|nr:hypothetical protein HMPREF2893_07600 [Streptococcus sp. HMSC072C09]RHC95827.1 hypothetical protein DW820_01465 [Streptococcus parasanguinis]
MNCFRSDLSISPPFAIDYKDYYTPSPKNVNTFYQFLSFSFKNSKSVQKKSRKELILLKEFFSHPHISSLKILSNKVSKHLFYLRYVLIIF